MVDPLRLARRLIEVSRGRNRELAGVRVYRGRPHPTRDPIGYAANRQPHCEVAAWASSQAVPRLRITGAKLWCHYLRVEDYRGMVDSSDYPTP
jgi:hypothetical protein